MVSQTNEKALEECIELALTGQISAIREVMVKEAMVSFSGKKSVGGVEYTEDIVNGFPDKDIEENFDTDEYRLLVVANKLLTGFDQPKLSTMYVDKKLQGVLAVQALSRRNRCNQKLGKRTEDMFVLDFFNRTADIKKAFDPFYTSTSLSEATDVNVLHDVKDKLDEVGVYEGADVELFNELYAGDSEFKRACVSCFRTLGTISSNNSALQNNKSFINKRNKS